MISDAPTCWRGWGRLLALTLVVVGLGTGCNPYKKAIKIGMKVVGDTVNEVDVSEHAKRLVGQPPAAADAAFGTRIRTLEEVTTHREMMTYPVKNDVLGMFRWIVEVQNGRIAALAKAQNNPDGGKDIIEKTALKQLLVGKTPEELQSKDKFKKLILVLRDRAGGNLIRVYDVSGFKDLMGAVYCVLEFDSADRCKDIRLVGVPAASSGSTVGRN
jgi:hypothetical protein